MSAVGPPSRWVPPDPFPMPIETPRLCLRWYEPDDAPTLVDAVGASRRSLLPWLAWATAASTDPGEVARTFESMRRERQGAQASEFTMGVFDRHGGALVGGTGLHRLRHATADAEVGYWLREGRRGQGLCREAVAALIDAAFADWGLRRIRVCCAAPNARSRRVPEALGLRLEAVEREERWIDGLGWTDGVTYAVLAREWDRERRRGPGGATVPD